MKRRRNAPFLFHSFLNPSQGTWFLSSIGLPAQLSTKVLTKTDTMNTLQASSSYKKRLLFAGLWTYATLNYLYCDLMAFMDADMHLQYHTGQVEDFVFTPTFLVSAALFMQIPIANVFLPFILRDKALKWTQVVCGLLMSIVQTATLFAGKPTPYYALFTALEVSATLFILFYALRWEITKFSAANGK